MDLFETLKKYIALVGIVTTICGCFYALGVFNNRLDELEQSKSTNTIKSNYLIFFTTDLRDWMAMYVLWSA